MMATRTRTLLLGVLMTVLGNLDPVLCDRVAVHLLYFHKTDNGDVFQNCDPNSDCDLDFYYNVCNGPRRKHVCNYVPNLHSYYDIHNDLLCHNCHI